MLSKQWDTILALLFLYHHPYMTFYVHSDGQKPAMLPHVVKYVFCIVIFCIFHKYLVLQSEAPGFWWSNSHTIFCLLKKADFHGHPNTSWSETQRNRKFRGWILQLQNKACSCLFTSPWSMLNVNSLKVTKVVNCVHLHSQQMQLCGFS